MNLVDISNAGFVAAFFAYVASFVGFVIAITGRRFSNRAPEAHTKRWGGIALTLTFVGLAAHLTYFFTRWAYNHIPTSNLFEFLAMLSMLITIAFVIIYFIYRTPVLGVFAMPISFIILAYASVYPWDAQPLIPPLQSIWLYIHVTTAALGEAFFAVGFAAGFMYLLRTVDFKGDSKMARRKQRGVEGVVISILFIVGFIVSVFVFRGLGYEAHFIQIQTTVEEGVEQSVEVDLAYTLPPIFGPEEGELVSMDPFLGLEEPLMDAPSWLKGVNAGKKLNTVTWSVLSGLLLYGLFRLLLRKPVGAAIQPSLKDMDPEDLDEISYRAIAIGFPIFTLGALIFAMIWAEIAWSRFWGWDPKEIWALVTWLFYSYYLHVRLSRGWQGSRSSWLAVIGFVIVMFTLIGVNLVIAGLHSYAGV